MGSLTHRLILSRKLASDKRGAIQTASIDYLRLASISLKSRSLLLEGNINRAITNTKNGAALKTAPLITYMCPLTFLDVPEQAYNRATLGLYEMARVELLRDLYVWAYERSTQEYLAIKQDLAEPDPLRLTWRDFIKQTINLVMTSPSQDPYTVIQQAVKEQIPNPSKKIYRR